MHEMPERPHTARRIAAAAAVVAALTAGLLGSASPAAALMPGEIGVFPVWNVSGTSGAFAAVPVFPASSAFPATSLTSTSTTLAAPSGVTAFLGRGTDFGAEFGSSRAQPYLSLTPAAGRTPSVTTLTFATPPPAGWGFALGDIDADWAFIEAFGGPGLSDPVAVADLGFQSVGNYCADTPRPGACVAGPFTDMPVWVTAPELFDGINYTPGTLRGNSLPGSPAATLDTFGAYGWFQPAVPVHTLRITFGLRDGFPSAQLWLASPAPKVIVTGKVDDSSTGGSAVPPGTEVQVNDATGVPLRDLEEGPLRVPVDPATGTYTVELEQSADGYQLAVVPPPGFVAPATVDVPGIPSNPPSLTVVVPPISMLPTAVTPPDPGDGDGDGDGGGSGEELADSGAEVPTLLLFAAFAALIVGVHMVGVRSVGVRSVGGRSVGVRSRARSARR